MNARVVFARVMWRVAAVAAIVTASITGAIVIEQDIAASNRSHQNFQQQIDALNNDINALAHGLHVVLPEPLPVGATPGRTAPSPHATSRPATSSPTGAPRSTPTPTPAGRPATTPAPVCVVLVCVG